MKDYFYGLVDGESKLERSYLRRICIVLLIASVIGYVLIANAEPLFKAEAGGVVIVIYSEDCAVKAVTNLPKRATWTENGKTFEGCVGATPVGMFMFYFAEDKTVTIAPMDAFVRAVGV